MGLLTRTRDAVHMLGLVPLLGGCVPELGEDLWRVDGRRLLAIRAEPPEAPPGAEVGLRALVVDERGILEDASPSWAFCVARRPLAELGPVSRACLEEDGDGALAIGDGTEVTGMLPAEACRWFGPDPPPAEAGQPPGRPVDPDVTGGYVQPVRILEPDATPSVSIFGVRMVCGIAGATQRQALEIRMRFQANTSPRIATLEAATDGRFTAIAEDEPLAVRPNAEVSLRARWESCPEAPACGDGLCTLDETAAACPDDCTDGRGCEGAETHVWFDPIARAVATRRESLSLAWFTTGGELTEGHTGRSSNDPASESTNAWIAPAEPGTVKLWIVLRDDRSGVSWLERTIDVRP